MRLLAPTLEVDEIASIEQIDRVLNDLPGSENPYMILERSQLTYAQVLWVGSGYELEYQEGSIDQHFVSNEALSFEVVNTTLKGYLKNSASWNHGIEFRIKDIRGHSGRLGYWLGHVIGKLFGRVPKT